MTAPQGKGAVKDLVIRFTGPRTLVASGHAAEPGCRPTSARELQRSGRTWTPVSASTSSTTASSRSIPGGSSRPRAAPSRSARTAGARSRRVRRIRVAAARHRGQPPGPGALVVSNQSGTFMSTNEGRSSRRRDTTASPRLARRPRTSCSPSASTARPPRRRRRQLVDEEGHAQAGPKEVAAAPDELYAITAGGKCTARPTACSGSRSRRSREAALGAALIALLTAPGDGERARARRQGRPADPDVVVHLGRGRSARDLVRGARTTVVEPATRAGPLPPAPGGLSRVLTSRVLEVVCGAIGVALLVMVILCGFFGRSSRRRTSRPRSCTSRSGSGSCR